MIYLDFPRRDLMTALRDVAGIEILDERAELPLVGDARHANAILPGTPERSRVLARGASLEARAAWYREVLASLQAPPDGALAVAAGLMYGFATWARVRPHDAADTAWIDALFDRKAAILLIARDDGTRAVRMRRPGFTDGTVELHATCFPDLVEHVDAWRDAERARREAIAEQAWRDGEAALASVATAGAWRRAPEAPLPSVASLHHALARVFDQPEHALWRASDVDVARWREALAQLGARRGPCWVGLGAAAPGWFLVEADDHAVWLAALFGAALAKGSTIASGWTKTLRNLVVVRGDGQRALAVGEAENEIQVAWLPVPPR